LLSKNNNVRLINLLYFCTFLYIYFFFVEEIYANKHTNERKREKARERESKKKKVKIAYYSNKIISNNNQFIGFHIRKITNRYILKVWGLYIYSI
jgi:hypothetical protein